MHGCCYSCLFFLFTLRSREILGPQATPGLLRDYKEVMSSIWSKKQNGRQRKQFLKIKLSLMLLIFINVLLSNKLH